MGNKKQRDVVAIKAPIPDLQDRLLANAFRAMETPATVCVSRGPVYEDEHQPSPFVIVKWTVAGVSPKVEGLGFDTWFCDFCETEMTSEERNGQCCYECGRHVEPAADRPRLIIAIRPCLRCGVVYLDKQHV